MGFDIREYKREYRRETYLWRKTHGICVRCGREDAEPHKTKCVECLGQEAACAKKFRDSMSEAQKREQSKRRRLKRDARKTSGLCVCCGKKVSKGKSYCLECWIKERRRKKAQYETRRMKTDFAEGLCCRCNEPALPGKKLCEKHYACVMRGIEVMNRRNQERKASAHHIWRRDNNVAFRGKKK